MLSDFVYSFFEHNPPPHRGVVVRVVNCFQILYIRSLNTIARRGKRRGCGCELLSDFVYSFFEHNGRSLGEAWRAVVNCFQILYIRSLNTIEKGEVVDSKQVVNCFQILYIRSLNTIEVGALPETTRL